MSNKIEALLIGVINRLRNTKLKDPVDSDMLKIWICRYIRNYNETLEDNKVLKYRKRRHENFPSEISENIVKFAFFKKYNIMPTWDTSSGDLVYNYGEQTRKIECKAYSSSGPSSFGPTENWDWIYFVDARKFKDGKYIVYEIRISNESELWSSLNFSKKETYGNMVERKIRPRTSFESTLKIQLETYCTVLFNGHINKLLDDLT
jgi:hypothetical protein